ncbi:hypothetical protein [Paenibacillus sp. FSL R7-0331]|uniref:hypothetical protein n=1 Tax=Paenibacillus sp. FSL R7-0331 TaxID=1536773 RepID=UPI000ADF2793|nr:hypothetical protein [Paenibacillus sp. FSL R7-0331]
MEKGLQLAGLAAVMLVLLYSAKSFFYRRDLRMLGHLEDEAAVRKAEEVVQELIGHKG